MATGVGCGGATNNPDCYCSNRPMNPYGHWVYGTDGKNYEVPWSWLPGDSVLDKLSMYGDEQEPAWLNRMGRTMYPCIAIKYTTVPVAVKLPEHCKVCNHHNPYVGVEHLTPAGDYVCRTCKPSWERKQRVAVFTVEAAARVAKDVFYGQR